jgi:hypothetical protein
MTDGIADRGPVPLVVTHRSRAHLRRRGGLLVGAVTLMLGCAGALGPAASAGGHFRIPAPIGGDGNTFAAGDACPFPLHTVLVGGNQVLTFFDNDRFHATGRHLDQLTNLVSETSIRLDLQGSVDAVPTADGGSIIRGSGITGFVFFPGDAGPGDTATGRFYLFTGTFVATSDPSGVITDFTSAGNSQDVCAMLT